MLPKDRFLKKGEISSAKIIRSQLYLWYLTQMYSAFCVVTLAQTRTIKNGGQLTEMISFETLLYAIIFLC